MLLEHCEAKKGPKTEQVQMWCTIQSQRHSRFIPVIIGQISHCFEQLLSQILIQNLARAAMSIVCRAKSCQLPLFQ